MAVTSWLYPGTVATDTSNSSGTYPFNFLSYVQADDFFSCYAGPNSGAGDYSYGLRCTNFDAGSYIPSGATLDGIEVEIGGSVQTTDTGGAVNNAEIIRLCKNGFLRGSNKATSIFWDETEDDRLLGGSSDKWGTSDTRADVVDSTYGVEIQTFFGGINEDGDTYSQFNYVRMRFYYTESASPPTVTTQAVSSIGTTTATGNGNVTSDGGATITERGVCWNTSTNPTTANSKATSSGTTGAYTANITGLTPGVLYYVRAYAINSEGTSYGDNVTFRAHYALSVAGSVTGSGVVAKAVSKFWAGSSTVSGVIAKAASKFWGGSATGSGAVSIVRELYRSYAGDLTPAGAIAKAVSKMFGGTSTASGTIARQSSVTLAGSSTASGALIKQVEKFFAGSATGEGALEVLRTFTRTYSGEITATGSITKATSKALAASITVAGALAKQTAKNFGGSTTASGALETVKTFARTYTGEITASGSILKAIEKGFTASATAAGAIAKEVHKGGSGSVTPSGGVSIPPPGLSLAGVISAAGTLTRQVNKFYTGSLTLAGTVRKAISKFWGGAVALAGSVAAVLVPGAPPGTGGVEAQITFRVKTLAVMTLGVKSVEEVDAVMSLRLKTEARMVLNAR